METDPAAAPRLDDRYRLAIALSFTAASAVALVVVAARFPISMVSLTDDWGYATEPGKSLWQLLDNFVQTPYGRYRPTYEILMHVQWRVFGAPEDVTFPNLVAILRTLLFVGALVVVPGVVAATGRPRPSPARLAALGVAAALFVFAGPMTDIDFLRLGVQEPLLFGALVCGGALTVWATLRLIDPEGDRPGTGMLAAAFAVGYLLWVVGVFFKEASMAVAVMTPFLYLHLDRRARERGAAVTQLWRQRPLQLAALAMALPLVAVAIGARSASSAGIGLYGAERPEGVGGWITRAWDALSLEWDTLADGAQMPAWQVTAVALLVLALGVAIHRRRIPWLAFGFLATGWALLDFQGFLLSPQTRFVIPGVAMFAAGGILLLARAPAWLSWVAVAAAVALAAVKADDVHTRVTEWVDWEVDDNARIVELTAELHPETCPVYLGRVGVEQAESLPRVLPIAGGELSGPCTPGYAGLIVGHDRPFGPPGADFEVTRSCADPGGPELVERTPGETPYPGWTVHGCHSFSRGGAVEDILRRNRFVPGVAISEVRGRCASSYGGERCFPELPTAQ